MELTAALKSWAQTHLGVAADASDDAFRAAISKALNEKKLTVKELASLCEPAPAADDDDPKKMLADIVTKAVIAGVKAIMPIPAAAPVVVEPVKAVTPVTVDPTDATATEMERVIDLRVQKHIDKLNKAHGTHSPSFASAVMGSAGMSDPRVKSVVEPFSATRTAACYPMKTSKGALHSMGGRQAMIGSRPLDVPSDRDKAVIGATFKWKLWEQSHRQDPLYRPTDQDIELVKYAMAEEKWNGPVGIKSGNSEADMQSQYYLEGMKLTKDTEFALVNDVATGGAFATPEIWDDAVVLNAVLYGELFPRVETTNLPRGAFVHGVQLLTDPVISPTPGATTFGSGTETATDNYYDYTNAAGSTLPSATSGTQVVGGITVGIPAYQAPGIGQAYNQPIVEGNTGTYGQPQEYAKPTTGVTGGSINYLQNMAGVIGNFDIGIFPVVAAWEIGLDWESDSPVAWGNLLVDRVGIQMQATLDGYIAIGTGAGQPLGLFKSACATVTATNSGYGSVGPLVKADIEKLIFGISKAMRASKGGKCCFVMNDQQYRLTKAIPWLAGAAAVAQARVYPDLESYKLEEHDVAIQIGIDSGAMAFANLAYYRMIRRLGMSVRQTTEGQNLMMQNVRLMVARARWGGRLTKPDALAVMTGAEYPDHSWPATSYGPAYSGGGTYTP